MGFNTAEPSMYGRVIANGSNISQIVEAKDASEEQLKITLCNSGVILGKATLIFDLISKIKNDNASNCLLYTSPSPRD